MLRLPLLGLLPTLALPTITIHAAVGSVVAKTIRTASRGFPLYWAVAVALGSWFLFRRHAASRIWRRARGAGSLRCSDEVSGPVACGFTRNQILLPLAAEDWSPETMKQVLAHEQADGTRFDIAWDLLGPLVVAVCWIQPFAWIALRELRREREWACDDLVLDLGLDRIEYAQTISEFAATSSLQPAMAGSGRGNLEERMKHLLNINAPRRKVTLLSAILATLGSVAMASTLPMLSLAQDKETKPYDKPPRVSYKVEPQYTEGAREVDVPATIEVNFKLK